MENACFGYKFVNRIVIFVPFICLCSCIQMLGKLKQLVYLDVSKNNLEMVDEQICGCESLQDLLLSNNALTQLPGSIGNDSCIDDLYRKSFVTVVILCVLPLPPSFLGVIRNDCRVVCMRLRMDLLYTLTMTKYIFVFAARHCRKENKYL